MSPLPTQLPLWERTAKPSTKPLNEPSVMCQTSHVRNFLSTFECWLPKESLPLIREKDVVLVVRFTMTNAPGSLTAYRSAPVSDLYQKVGFERDWMGHNKLWFKYNSERESTGSNASEYVSFLSFMEDYRPEFGVNYTEPLFHLSLSEH